MTDAARKQVGMVLQARMGSTRLPGKVMMPLGGTTMLGWIIRRLKDLPWPLVVATSNKAQDDVIARQCEQMDVKCFRGSETDVLDRYYQCACENHFDHIVRLTADNPFTDIEELQRLIELHLIQHNDYTHSFGSLPLGVGAEIFSFAALEKSAREGHAPNHREHVNEYIQEHPGLFRIGVLETSASKRCPDLRLTVDTQEDYRRACAIAGQASDLRISTEEAIRLCLRSA